MNRVKKTIYIFAIMLLTFSTTILPVKAAAKARTPKINISKIKLNKKQFEAGEKVTLQININTNIKPKVMYFKYKSPKSQWKLIYLKPVNKARTKWKKTFKIKKNMVEGNWGIEYISISGKYEGKEVLYLIENNRWKLETSNKYQDVKRVNLSAGNFKIKGTS